MPSQNESDELLVCCTDAGMEFLGETVNSVNLHGKFCTNIPGKIKNYRILYNMLKFLCTQ